MPSLTGIAPNSGAGNYNLNLGLVTFTTPNIAPDASWDYVVSNYFINCFAFTGTQWIKGEVHYSVGGFDNCTSGNFVQEPITIF